MTRCAQTPISRRRQRHSAAGGSCRSTSHRAACPSMRPARLGRSPRARRRRHRDSPGFTAGRCGRVALFAIEAIERVQGKATRSRPGSAGENLTTERDRVVSLAPAPGLDPGPAWARAHHAANPCDTTSDRTSAPGSQAHLDPKLIRSDSRMYARVLTRVRSRRATPIGSCRRCRTPRRSVLNLVERLEANERRLWLARAGGPWRPRAPACASGSRRR